MEERQQNTVCMASDVKNIANPAHRFSNFLEEPKVVDEGID